MCSSCSGCGGRATSTGGGGAKSPKQQMQIICNYDFTVGEKHFKGGTTRTESRSVTNPPPILKGSNIKHNLQEVDHVFSTDGLLFKIFYNNDIFGTTPKFTQLLDGTHDIALIEFIPDGEYFLARTEPIPGGRLGLRIDDYRHKTLFAGQGDVITDNSGEMSLYLSFDIVNPWKDRRMFPLHET